MTVLFQIAQKYGQDPDVVAEWDADKVYIDLLHDMEVSDYQKELRNLQKETNDLFNGTE